MTAVTAWKFVAYDHHETYTPFVDAGEIAPDGRRHIPHSS
jgi:hypothetical protein